MCKVFILYFIEILNKLKCLVNGKKIKRYLSPFFTRAVIILTIRFWIRQ